MKSAASKNPEVAALTDQPPSGSIKMDPKQLELELQQILREKEQLLNILNAMQDRVCIVDADGVIQYANPAMVDLYGPAVGQRCQDYLCGNDQPCTWCRPEGESRRRTQRYEWTCPRNRQTYDVVDTPIRDGERSSALLKIMHDVTAHKETEAQIRAIQKQLENEVRQRTQELEKTVGNLRQEVAEHLQTQAQLVEHTREMQRVAKLLELSHDSIIIHDMEGTITFWSLGAQRTFGWNKEEAMGQISHELLRTVFREPMVRIMGQIVRQGTWEGELIHFSKEGREVVVESRWALQTDDQGQPIAILEIDRDITDRKIQEREIYQHQNQLQALSEQLLIAEEHYRKHMSTVLHDSIGQLLSFAKRELSHLERRVPSELRDAFTRALGGINEAISQSREITQELSSPTLYTFGFEAAIEELGEILAAREGFTFRFQSGEIPADLGENLQILLYRSTRELIMNAIRHSRGETIEVEVQKSDNHVQITVQDDGRGFDVSVIDHYPKDQRKFGLFSIRERLTYIGGKFKIESSHEKGTKATILAPLRQQETMR